MNHDVETAREDLLESVRQMRRGESARVTEVDFLVVADARARVGLSLEEFAALLGVSPRTVRDWELGRRTPRGAARTLIRVAHAHPEALRRLRP
ncbi:MAG: helix-turn-helix domain-containing protein [Trueperaceae bacterium]|nr:helix-turn-helix domain-containing protein [Trueperaceae bacterium]